CPSLARGSISPRFPLFSSGLGHERERRTSDGSKRWRLGARPLLAWCLMGAAGLALAPASRVDAQAPAFLVRDVNRESPLTASGPRSFLTIGQVTFFVAETPATGGELWLTDGTTGGTFLVKDVNPGPSGSLASSFTELGGVLYFVALS